jgi:hypothetical protein
MNISSSYLNQLRRQNDILSGGRNDNPYAIPFNLYFIFILVIGFDL